MLLRSRAEAGLCKAAHQVGNEAGLLKVGHELKCP